MLNYEKLNRLNEKMFDVLNDEKIPEKIKVQKIEDLLDKGADVDAREGNAEGRNTPLLIAAYKGYKEVADMLLEKGVKKQGNKYKENESMKAVSELAECLGIMYSKQENNQDEVNLISMVKKGDVKQVKKMLEQGVDVSKKDKFGKTALDYAYEKNNVEMAGVLYVADRKQKEEKAVKYPMVVYKKGDEGM